MSLLSDRMTILNAVENGQMSVDEALRQIKRLHAQASLPQPRATPFDDPALRKWRLWWLIPLAVGAVGALAFGALTWWAYVAAGNTVTVWFFIWLLPALAGLAVMALAALSRNMRWLHVRIHTGTQAWPRHIAISLPLPLRFIGWVLRVAGPFVPKLRHTRVDDILIALSETLSPSAPFFVSVDEGEGQERVQVYIG